MRTLQLIGQTSSFSPSTVFMKSKNQRIDSPIPMRNPDWVSCLYGIPARTEAVEFWGYPNLMVVQSDENQQKF